MANIDIKVPDIGDFDEGEPDIIIAGFGRFGQVTGRLLAANGFKSTVLDSDIEQIELLRDALATLPPDAYVLLTEALKLAQHAEMLEIWGIMHLARQFAACVNQHANELDSVTARAALDDMLDKLSAGIDAVAV